MIPPRLQRRLTQLGQALSLACFLFGNHWKPGDDCPDYRHFHFDCVQRTEEKGDCTPGRLSARLWRPFGSPFAFRGLTDGNQSLSHGAHDNRPPFESQRHLVARACFCGGAMARLVITA